MKAKFSAILVIALFFMVENGFSQTNSTETIGNVTYSDVSFPLLETALRNSNNPNRGYVFSGRLMTGVSMHDWFHYQENPRIRFYFSELDTAELKNFDRNIANQVYKIYVVPFADNNSPGMVSAKIMCIADGDVRSKKLVNAKSTPTTNSAAAAASPEVQPANPPALDVPFAVVTTPADEPAADPKQTAAAETQTAKKTGGFSMSAGGGGIFTVDFTNSSLDRDPIGSQVFLGGGANLFFDATYGEVNLGFVLGGMDSYDKDGEKVDKTVDLIYLRIGALGKFPIKINNAFTLFPLLGIDYTLSLSAGVEGKPVYSDAAKQAEALDAFWFKLGAGADFALTDKLFIRSELLYGIRTNTTSELDQLEKNSAAVDSIIGHGLDLKIGIGYKFFNKSPTAEKR